MKKSDESYFPKTEQFQQLVSVWNSLKKKFSCSPKSRLIRPTGWSIVWGNPRKILQGEIDPLTKKLARLFLVTVSSLSEGLALAGGQAVCIRAHRMGTNKEG